MSRSESIMIPTGGKWRVARSNERTFDILVESDGISSRIARLHVECLAEEHGGSVEANAHLIAAAPDLLAVAAYVKHLGDSGVMVNEKLYADARKAIAKAVGS